MAQTLPAMSEPDFSSSTAVVASINTMSTSLSPLAEGDGAQWRPMRAKAACDGARYKIARLVSAGAYTEDSGRRNWTDCHRAYSRAR